MSPALLIRDNELVGLGSGTVIGERASKCREVGACIAGEWKVGIAEFGI